MATNPRDWPNNARVARDQSSIQAARAMRALRPLLENYNQMAKEEVIARAAVALDALQMIARFMEKQGAPTIPEEIEF